MDDKILHKVFKEADRVETIKIDNGEITLVPDKLETMCDAIEKNNAEVDDYMIFTNGTNGSDYFFEQLGRLNKLVKNPENSVLFASATEFHIEQGINKFGKKKHMEILEKFSEHPLFTGWALLPGQVVVRSGLAKSMTDPDFAYRPVVDRTERKIPYMTNNDFLHAWWACVSTHGDLIVSEEFKEQDKDGIGNILTHGMSNVIESSDKYKRYVTGQEYSNACRNIFEKKMKFISSLTNGHGENVAAEYDSGDDDKQKAEDTTFTQEYEKIIAKLEREGRI
jgi:hypothetical protein